mgnify:CR=1 FL=1
MVASEAISSGIPVLTFASEDTKGLIENLGNAGYYTLCNTSEEYIRMIRQLDDEEVYSNLKRRSLARAQELDQSKIIKPFLDWFDAPVPKLGILIVGCRKYLNHLNYQNNYLRTIFPHAVIQPCVGEGEEIHEDVMVVPVKDSYENLHLKVLGGLKQLMAKHPDLTHVMKIDDDIVLSNPEVIQGAVRKQHLDYCGAAILNSGVDSSVHQLKVNACSQPVSKFVPSNIDFLVGGYYVLSKKAIDVLLNNQEPTQCILEDVNTAHVLGKQGIKPEISPCKFLERPRYMKFYSKLI